MKKIPRSFKVFGQKVTISHKLPDKYKQNFDGYMLWGLYMPNELAIYINPDQGIEQQWRTLYHELGHALMYRMGLPYNNEFTDGLHEQIVEGYANFIYESFHKEG